MEKIEFPEGVIIKNKFGPFETNCYVLLSKEEACIIDPSPFDENEKKILYNQISSIGCLKYIINTHGHFDHISGNSFLKENFENSRIGISLTDSPYLTDPNKNFSLAYGREVVSPKEDFNLDEGTIIEVGNFRLKVLFTPGHTKGSVSLAGNGFVFTGDTLFAGTVGIAKEYKGAFDELMNSIKEKLLILPLDTIVFPGHGENSTIKEEKEFNPFLSN